MEKLPICILVGGWATPLKNMSSSIGMMTFPTEWENKKWQPNHQPVYLFVLELPVKHGEQKSIAMRVPKGQFLDKLG